MIRDLDKQALEITLAEARRQLLACRLPSGHWEGHLSSSALSTATAVCALAVVDAKAHEPLIARGLDWLARNADPDGGWGDTTVSKSNLSTTVLAWSAFAAAGRTGGHYSRVLATAESWIARAAGSVDPRAIASAIARRYGEDRTFSAPILTMCALSGRLGQGRDAWRVVPALPFELAACPHRWWKWLHLPVVSYALPALIAIGQARFHHLRPRNPLAWLVRRLTRRRTLAVLEDIQPSGGGFLEAPPLTSFVVMSLAASGHRDHPVVSKGVAFLTGSARPDGSWPIDTNLAAWVTTLSVNALAAGGCLGERLGAEDRRAILDWLLAQQTKAEHPYTHAAPGGWAWTDLPGGVTDADDTAGALLALRNLTTGRGGTGAPPREDVLSSAAAGVRWLLGVQNRNGGIPTFCRGWGTLPFDRSSPDLTAHALAAWSCWLEDLGTPLGTEAAAAMRKAVAYLGRVQRPDGSWSPLWFGNQHAPNDENLTYGTARVVLSLAGCAEEDRPAVDEMVRRGVGWLVSAQGPDGGWGGAPGTPCSIEETALATDALAKFLLGSPRGGRDGELVESVESAIPRGVSWLVRNTNRGETMDPSPIGFYFAKLWYFERMYPLVFTVSAMERVAQLAKRQADTWG